MTHVKVEYRTMEASGWQKRKKLVECNQHLLESGIASDVKIIVGVGDNRRTFLAHKFILSSRSSVFYDMFIGEGGNKDDYNVIVTDVDPRGFDSMLQYIYCDKIEITESNVLYVLEASVKYQIEILEEKALEYIPSCQVPEKICCVLDQAVFYHKDELITECLTHYRHKPDIALKSESFKDISYQTLLKIVRTEDVPLTETILFEACEGWAIAECNRRNMKLNGSSKRKCLGEALYYIRFPLMAIDYFANCVSMKGILSDEEELSTFRYIAKSFKAKASQHLVFGKETRGNTVSRFEDRQGDYSWENGNTFDLSFTTNKKIQVFGFRSKNFEHSNEMVLYVKCDGEEILSETELVKLKDGVQLDKPVIIDAQRNKKFLFTLYSSTAECYTEGGQDGLHIVTGIDGVTFTFDRPYTAGFIDELMYYKL